MGQSLTTIVFQPPPVVVTNVRRAWTWLRTKNNVQFPAFYIDNQSKVTILFSHGNAEDLDMIFDWFAGFSKALGVNVFAYDYVGYGKATGDPTEQACYDTIVAAFAHLTDEVGVRPENIVLYGRSIGTGPSVYLASKLAKDKVPVGGIILQCPLLSVFRVAFPFRFTLPGDMFPNVDRIKDVACPVFIIHGTKDEVVPFWNGEQLFLATPVHLRAKPFWVDGGGHNNLEIYYRESNVFSLQFRDFLSQWVPAYQIATLMEEEGSTRSTKSQRSKRLPD